MLRHKIPVILAKKGNRPQINARPPPPPPLPPTASRSRYEQQQNTRSILRLKKKTTFEGTFMGLTFSCLEIVKM